MRVLTTMPMSNAPVTFFTINKAENRIANIDNKTAGSLMLPNVTNVASEPLMMPPLRSPIKAMNKPIPGLIDRQSTVGSDSMIF